MPKEKRLRHVRRPQQGHHMSFKSPERHFRRQKAPAACKKTSTGLLDVLQIPGTSFLPTKKRLRHVRKPQQGYCMSLKSPERYFANKKAPAARKKTTPRYHSQTALAIFVTGHTHIQFEL